MKLKALVTATLLSGNLVLTPATYAGDEITVVSSGANTRAQVGELWSRETGNEIHSKDYSADLIDIRQQVEARNVTWDIVDVELSDAIRACDEGLLEKIDHTSLPRGDDGIPAVEDFIEGTLYECAVAHSIWSTIFAYDKSKWVEGPETMADFFDWNEFPGKRGLRKKAEGNLELALIADGIPAEDVYEALRSQRGVDRAFRKLDEISGCVIWWEHGAQPSQLLADGEVVMTTAYNTRIFNAVAGEKKPFEIVWDGQVWEPNLWVIPKGLKNKELAFDFLNFSTSRKALAAQASLTPYGPTRKSSLSYVGRYALDESIDMQLQMPTHPDNLVNAVQSDVEFWAENSEHLNERFNAWLSMGGRANNCVGGGVDGVISSNDLSSKEYTEEDDSKTVVPPTYELNFKLIEPPTSVTDATVEVLAPNWLIKSLPTSDPNFTSEVKLHADIPSSQTTADVLSSWCSIAMGSDPSKSLALEELEADLLIVDADDLEDIIRDDRKIQNCLNSNNPLNPVIVQKVLAFDGIVPFTRMQYDKVWTPSEFTELLSGSRPTELTENLAPNESVSYKAVYGVSPCECIEGDQDSWTSKLLDGWLLIDKLHCKSSPLDKPKLICAGLHTFETYTNSQKLASLHLLPKPLHIRNILSQEDFFRFFGKHCETEFSENTICNEPSYFLTAQLEDFVEVYGAEPGSFVTAQLRDLVEADGTGLFLLPLGNVLVNDKIDSNGEIKNRLVDQLTDLDYIFSLDKLLGNFNYKSPRYGALGNREGSYPLKMMSFEDEDPELERSIAEILLSKEYPYTRRISLVVNKTLLGQHAINSYIKHLTQEWVPSDMEVSTIVTIGQFRGGRIDEFEGILNYIAKYPIEE